jgi:hypothetical protein
VLALSRAGRRFPLCVAQFLIAPPRSGQPAFGGTWPLAVRGCPVT